MNCLLETLMALLGAKNFAFAQKHVCRIHLYHNMFKAHHNLLFMDNKTMAGNVSQLFGSVGRPHLYMLC